MSLMLCTTALPTAATAEPGRMLDYLRGASTEDAADYLAFLIRTFGCEVRRDEREAFNEAVLDHLSFDFGLPEIEVDANGARILSEDLREGLFAFSFRAGPHLVERGELTIDRDGTARLLTCNALLS